MRSIVAVAGQIELDVDEVELVDVDEVELLGADEVEIAEEDAHLDECV